MVSIMITTPIARDRCGSVMNTNCATAPAPSMRAASRCSWSSDCTAVSRISSANGSHSHDTMAMTEASGYCANQSTGSQPERRATAPSTP